MSTLNPLVSDVVDPGTWQAWDAPPEYGDIDDSYRAALAKATERAGVDEAVTVGAATIGGRSVALLVGEFEFLAGSVGAATAQRLVGAIERATTERLPLIGLPCSGGTRMQEGTPAFVHMNRIAAALARHRSAGLPYLVHLSHPTTGGVMATWGSLGHLTTGTPGALAGFLGPRVYETLYGEPFPDGVQVTDHLAEVGVIDSVVATADLRDHLLACLDVLDPTAAAQPVVDPAAPDPASDPVEPESPADVWDAILATREPDRPGVREILDLADTCVPLSGTGEGEVDPAIRLALVRFGGTRCVLVGQDRVAQQERPFGPAGLRVARRGMRLAAELDLPLVTIVDTPGAELSAAAEEGAMAGEIARCLAELSQLRVPSLGVLLGQGNGGGALALLGTRRVIAAVDAWLSPLPPEGASAIVHRDLDHAADMARAQRVGAADLAGIGFVHRRFGGADLAGAAVTAIRAELS